MKWHENSWAAILFLVVFFPVGLFLMRKYQHWNQKARFIVTGAVALVCIIVVVSNNTTEEYEPVLSQTEQTTNETTEHKTEPETLIEATTTEAEPEIVTEITTATTPAPPAITIPPTAPPTPPPTPAPMTEAPAPVVMVWLSATGSRWHAINNCGTMNPANARQISLEDARARGYTPCDNCNPPR